MSQNQIFKQMEKREYILIQGQKVRLENQIFEQMKDIVYVEYIHIDKGAENEARKPDF